MSGPPAAPASASRRKPPPAAFRSPRTSRRRSRSPSEFGATQNSIGSKINLNSCVPHRTRCAARATIAALFDIVQLASKTAFVSRRRGSFDRPSTPRNVDPAFTEGEIGIAPPQLANALLLKGLMRLGVPQRCEGRKRDLGVGSSSTVSLGGALGGSPRTIPQSRPRRPLSIPAPPSERVHQCADGRFASLHWAAYGWHRNLRNAV